MFLPDCLSVCEQDNLKSYGRIFLKFWGYVGHGTNYQWFNFGHDLAGILDSGSLWNFCYHCVKGGIREPLAKWIWWRHLANNVALAEVPAGYDCFLVDYDCELCRSGCDIRSSQPTGCVSCWHRPLPVARRLAGHLRMLGHGHRSVCCDEYCWQWYWQDTRLLHCTVLTSQSIPRVRKKRC